MRTLRTAPSMTPFRKHVTPPNTTHTQKITRSRIDPAMALCRTVVAAEAAALLLIAVALTTTTTHAAETTTTAPAPGEAGECSASCVSKWTTAREGADCSSACTEACDLFEGDRAEVSEALKKHCYRFCMEGCTKEGMDTKAGCTAACDKGCRAGATADEAFAEADANATPTA
ncbi:hypothetical protein ACP4OV_020140 [Aristida adscensionis]